MALRGNVFKIALATAVGLVIGVGTQMESEASGYRYLCMTKPNSCEYAPSTAPTLNADVCWSTSSVKLKGTAPCPTGSYPFFVDSGEVTNPLTGTVQAYIKLPDACAMGYCVPGDINTPDQPGPMCCEAASGDCTETDGICPPDKVAVWCPDGHEAILQNGNWVCEESE
jgi:hypothetical protein